MAKQITEKRWSEIEAEFREWSFHVYYKRSFASEMDLTIRFCKAIIASAEPIHDRAKVLAWYRGDSWKQDMAAY